MSEREVLWQGVLPNGERDLERRLLAYGGDGVWLEWKRRGVDEPWATDFDMSAESEASLLAIRARDAELAALKAENERLREAIDEAINGWLPDMHDGEECELFGGDGCLACLTQRGLAEALDAPPPRGAALSHLTACGEVTPGSGMCPQCLDEPKRALKRLESLLKQHRIPPPAAAEGETT